MIHTRRGCDSSFVSREIESAVGVHSRDAHGIGTAAPDRPDPPSHPPPISISPPLSLLLSLSLPLSHHNEIMVIDYPTWKPPSGISITYVCIPAGNLPLIRSNSAVTQFTPASNLKWDCLMAQGTIEMSFSDFAGPRVLSGPSRRAALRIYRNSNRRSSRALGIGRRSESICPLRSCDRYRRRGFDNPKFIYDGRRLFAVSGILHLKLCIGKEDSNITPYKENKNRYKYWVK